MNNKLNNVRIETFQFVQKLLIGSKWINITFKEARLIRENRRGTAIGDMTGHIDIVYPFAGLELKLTLEIYNEMVDDDLNIVDGVFKIPFTDIKIPMHDLFFYREMLEDDEVDRTWLHDSYVRSFKRRS